MEQENLHPKPPSSADWGVGSQIWDEFTAEYQLFKLRQGHWAFHNFLRNYKKPLVEVDAIRLAKRKYWIAHRQRFKDASFALLTGKHPNQAIAVDNISRGSGQQEAA